MKTSGLFTVHQVTVKTRPGQSWKLIPFGDVHRDSPNFSKTHWDEFLAYARAQPHALFLGMGDYMDVGSTSERVVIHDERLHESTRKVIADHGRGVVATLANELRFMRGRVLGLIGGNHYSEFDNTTSDHVLADKLGTRFLGVCTFIRLTFECGTKSASVDIFAHHGKGGGNLAGSTFNTVEKMQAVADADIYLMGHDHAKGAIPARPRLKLTHSHHGLDVKERTPVLGRTGSFLKAYEPGMVNYNVDACRSPSALGWIEFDLTFDRTRCWAEGRAKGVERRDVCSIRIRSTS